MPTSASTPLDHELSELLDLGDRILGMARARGGAGLVVECVLRSGAELSAKVRKGEPELVEEAGTRSAGMRVIQGKRVASTSTSDLTDAGIERFVSDAIELVSLSQEDPFAGPADPKLLCDPSKAPDLDLYDPAGGSVDAARAIAMAK
jgi:PmbA protein